ncbi:MAG: hypothetical protein KDH95_06335 [Calditrichaeota bacterium]|nr:hypothetical protein [Calditrichota bacterium]MCB0267765.1 hypothetical protein [Calditrichota bacterium]
MIDATVWNCISALQETVYIQVKTPCSLTKCIIFVCVSTKKHSTAWLIHPVAIIMIEKRYQEIETLKLPSKQSFWCVVFQQHKKANLRRLPDATKTTNSRKPALAFL